MKARQRKRQPVTEVDEIEAQWRPWQYFSVKLSFLVVLTMSVILWSSTSYAPSAPEDFDRATQPLEVLRYVQRGDLFAVRRVGFGTVRVPAEKLLTTVLLNVETWHPLSGGAVDDLDYDLSLLLEPDSSYSLLYFEEDSRKVAICYQGRYRMYRLPEKAYEVMVMTHSLSSNALAFESEALPVPLQSDLPEPYQRLGSLSDGSRLFYRPAEAPWPLDVPWPSLVPTGHPLAKEVDLYKDVNPIGPGAIALKTPQGHWQLLALGMPSKPLISPDKKRVAWIDNLAFEVIGTPWVYSVESISMRQVMPLPYNLEPHANYTAKQVVWQDNQHLAMVWGYGFGTVTQGGDVYRVEVPSLRSQCIYKAYDSNREEAVSVMRTKAGGLEARIVRWIDDNFMSYSYYNKKLEPLYPMGTSSDK